MGRPVLRLICVALGVALAAAPQFLQPHTASAATNVSVAKAVCNITTAGSCPVSSVATGANASTNDVVQYNLTYTNNTTSTATVTLTDALQAGQNFIQCVTLSGTPASCSVTAGTVTATIGGVAAGASGTIAIQVRITGTNSPISNSATAQGTVALICPAPYTYDPGQPGRCTTAPVGGLCPGGGVLNAGTCYITGSCPAGYSYSNPNAGPGQCTTPPMTSGVTTVTVTGAVGGGSCIGISKSVRDVTLGDNYTTSDYAYSGDLLRYRVSITNGCGGPVSNVTISDTLQSGQLFTGNCVPASCVITGNNVTFSLGTLPTGGSATVYFDANISQFYSSPVLSNQATVSSAGFTTGTSNTTTVTVYGGPVVPPVYNPPPIISPYSATLQICGFITAYTPAYSGYGYMTVNGINFTFMPYLIPGGSPFTTGQSACLTFTVNSAGQVTSVLVGPNIAGVNFVCGPLSPFNAGYYPYQGFNPYPGYNPNPGYAPYGGYGWYSFPGNAHYYGWGGPMLIGGYPFPVGTGTYFPSQLSYGNPYCFTMNSGTISGSLSVVPTAATPLEASAGIHRSGRHLAF